MNESKGENEMKLFGSYFQIVFRFQFHYIPNNLLLTICFADIICSLAEKATLPLASKLDR